MGTDEARDIMDAAANRERLRELGRAGGKKSGEVRRARAKVREDLNARQLFIEDAALLAQELLDAAHGRGVYSALDPKERAAVVKTCLEYAVGRPRPQDPLAVSEDDEAPKTGIRFGVAEVSDGSQEVDSEDGGEAEHAVQG